MPYNSIDKLNNTINDLVLLPLINTAHRYDLVTQLAITITVHSEDGEEAEVAPILP
jgi:hypothetical protein